jgi:hypothetical protein
MAVECLEEDCACRGVNEISKYKKYIPESLEPLGNDPCLAAHLSGAPLARAIVESWCCSQYAPDTHEPHDIHTRMPVRLCMAFHSKDEHEIEVDEREPVEHVNVE